MTKSSSLLIERAYPENSRLVWGPSKSLIGRMENIEKFKVPTKVHLQVFDGMCHVLTVFTFHDAVRFQSFGLRGDCTDGFLLCFRLSTLIDQLLNS